MKSKKATKRALLTSAMSLVLCFAMLLGSTYAWFTDEATTAVNTIQSGTLDVDLVAEDGVTSLDGETLSFQNFDADPSVGDYWEPNCTYYTQGFQVANLGNLWLKYQLAIGGITGDLMLLDVVDFYLTTNVSSVEAAKANRIDLDTFVEKLAPTTPSETYYLVGHMDMDAGNEYQNKTLKNIAVTVYATQVEAEFDSFGNDYDADANPNDFYCDILATPETIERILAEAEEGTIIGLAGGEYGSLKLTQNNLTLISNGSAVVDYIDLNAKDGTIIDGLTFNADNAGIAYSYNRTQGAFTDAGYTTSINDASAKEGTNVMAADDTVIRNCTFTGNGDVDKYIPVHFNAVSRTSDSLVNVTVDNNVFACNALQYLKLDYIHGEVIVTNNTFGGVDYRTGHNGINASGNSANWTITGNTFWNWNDEKAAFGSSRSSAAGVITITVKNNEFCNDGADEIPVLNLKNSYAAGNFALNYSGNTANYGTYTLAAVGEPVSGANDVYYYMTKDAASSIKIVAPGVIETATKTYEVASAQGLANLNDVLETVGTGEGQGATINLKADIDLAGQTWEPISSMWVTFNGNGHTISNLTAGMAADGRRSGFWAYAGAVTINDLTLENVTVSGSQAGIFAGAGEGLKVNNCFLKGDNVVNFVAGVETWNGIGAITGVLTTSNVNVEIVEGTTVTLNKGAMTTDPGCTYVDNLTGYIQANNGTVINNGKINVAVEATASTAEELKNAIASGNIVDVELAAGTYKLPTTTNKKVTISGTKDTIIDLSNGTGQMHNMDFVFDGVTIKGATGLYKGIIHSSSVAYKNCTLTGLQFLYAETVTFENCKFDSNGAEHCIWTYGAKNISFIGCDFTYGDRCVNVYLDNGTGSQNVSFTNCTFVTTSDASKGAVEINSSAFPLGVTVSFTGCTAPAYGTMVGISGWDSTNGASATVTVDGAAFTAPQWTK